MLFIKFIPLIFSIGFHNAATAEANYPGRTPREASVSTLWSWPAGSWAENVAVRQNGKLLVTRLDVPELWEVDPECSNATLVHRFTARNALLGITEVTHDVFAVVALDLTFSTLTITPGTSDIWTVDLSGYPWSEPRVVKVTTVTDAIFLNGLTTLNPIRGIVLAADSTGGRVYSVDIHTGSFALALQDEALVPAVNASLPLGVNGIHTRGKYLYFTNSFKFTFGRVELNSDGSAAGPYENVYSDSGPLYDDFAFSRRGDAYVTHTTTYGLTRISPKGDGELILANVNATLGNTAAAFSRDGKQTLYVVTSGGLAIGLAEPARVLAITGL